MRIYKPQFKPPDRRFLLIFCLSAITFFFNLGKAPIYILDEAKNAQCAREMLQHHNWIVPTFNGVLRTDKPPLHYFLMSAAYLLFGITPFAARFFSALCGLIVVVSTYSFAARHINKQVAVLSGLILLSSWHFGLEMRMAVPDPYLIVLMVLSLFSFYEFYNSSYQKFSYALGFYVAVGLGVLAKGPVAFALPCIIIPVFLYMQKQLNWPVLKQFHLVLGIAIIVIISFPWYYLVHQATKGEWTQEFFFMHNYRRFITPKEKHGGFFLLPALYVVMGLLPASVFIFQTAVYNYKKALVNPLIRFLGVAAGIIILFFTFSSTKLPNYPMPCHPLVSILLANYLYNVIRNSQSLKPFLYVLLLVGGAIPVVLFILIPKQASLTSLTSVWLPYTILPVSIIAALCYQYSNFAYRNRFSIHIVLIAFLMTGWILHFYTYSNVYELNPVTVGLQRQPVQEPLVSYRLYNPAYNFQLTMPVKRFENVDSLKAYLLAHPGSQVITHNDHLQDLKGLPLTVYFEGMDIFEKHTNYMLRHN